MQSPIYNNKLIFVGLFDVLKLPLNSFFCSISEGFPTDKDYNLSASLDIFKITIRYRLHHKKELRRNA